MENFLHSDLVTIVLSFLNQKDILSYSYALTNHKLRNIFINSIKNLEFHSKHLKISKFTNLYNIYCQNHSLLTKENIFADIYNYKLIKNVKINNLYLCNPKFLREKSILVENDYVKKITIDLGRKNNFISIKSKSIETLIFIACHIDAYAINKICENCENIKTIKLFCCDLYISDIHRLKNNLLENKNINLLY